VKACAEVYGAPITRIICSPFLRCVETAAATAEVLGIERICIDWGYAEYMNRSWYRVWDAAKLVERGLAVAQPRELLKTAEELHKGVDKRVDAHYQSISSVDTTVSYEKPETYKMMAKRVAKMLRQLARRHPGESMLLVGHGGTVGCTYGILCPEMGSQDHSIPYASLSIAEQVAEDAWRMQLVADSSHY